MASILPAAGWSPTTRVLVEHQPVPEAGAEPRAGYQAVSSGYFHAMRIPIVSGRAFSGLDREDTQPVAVVSAATASRLWPDDDAVGRRLRIGDANEWHTVVGVAGDVTMYNWWDGVDYQRVYVPSRQAAPEGVLYAAVRTRGEPAATAATLRDAVRAVDPAVPIQQLRTMERAIASSSLGLNFLATLMAICGLLAALLAAIGIYGMMSYAVSQRAREFGIRIALGGTARDMVGLTLRQAGVLTAAGLAAGSAMALLFGWALARSLFGLVSLDPVTFVVVGIGLAVVALGAAYLPARRTLRLDPAAILRG